MSIKVTTTRIPTPTTTFIGNPNITASFFRTATNPKTEFRFRNSRLYELVPPLHVSDAFLIALDYDFGAFLDWLSIFTARPGTPPPSSKRENNFSRPVFPDGHAHSPESANNPAILFSQRLIGWSNKLEQESQDNPARGKPSHRGDAYNEKCFNVRVLRHEITYAAEPRQKCQHG